MAGSPVRKTVPAMVVCSHTVSMACEVMPTVGESSLLSVIAPDESRIMVAGPLGALMPAKFTCIILKKNFWKFCINIRK